jgi:hypothetical protein
MSRRREVLSVVEERRAEWLADQIDEVEERLIAATTALSDEMKKLGVVGQKIVWAVLLASFTLTGATIAAIVAGLVD